MLLFLLVLLLCFWPAVANTQGSCADKNPYTSYSYRYASQDYGENPRFKLDCNTVKDRSSPWTFDKAVVAFNYVLNETVHNPQLSLILDQTEEAKFRLGIYGDTGERVWPLLFHSDLFTTGTNGQQWFMAPITGLQGNTLKPARYVVAVLGVSTPNFQMMISNNDFSDYTYSIDQNCGTDWARDAPTWGDFDTWSNYTVDGPTAIGIVGSVAPPAPKQCNCTLEVWFNQQNCTNPGNGTAAKLYGGNCDHVDLPGKATYSIATAHDCAAYAIYHGKECFGSTVPQYPNRCFNDGLTKGSYLVSCPPGT